MAYLSFALMFLGIIGCATYCAVRGDICFALALLFMASGMSLKSGKGSKDKAGKGKVQP